MVDMVDPGSFILSFNGHEDPGSQMYLFFSAAVRHARSSNAVVAVSGSLPYRGPRDQSGEGRGNKNHLSEWGQRAR